MTVSFLNRARTIATPGYSRWLIPPAALCVHLCIGEAYAFSVFNLPLTKLLGITQSTPDDWKLTDLGWIFSIAIVMLGVSAAVFGRWVEEGGPRKAMFTAALCWGGGFLLSTIGVYLHNLWVIYLGYGMERSQAVPIRRRPAIYHRPDRTQGSLPAHTGRLFCVSTPTSVRRGVKI